MRFGSSKPNGQIVGPVVNLYMCVCRLLSTQLFLGHYHFVWRRISWPEVTKLHIVIFNELVVSHLLPLFHLPFMLPEQVCFVSLIQILFWEVL